MSNPRAISLSALLGVLLALICNSITQMFNQTVVAQSGGTMNTDALLALAIAVNRAVEAIKQNVLDRFLAGEPLAQVRAGLALFLSLILGVLGAGMFSLNLFAEFANVPFWVGVVVTGLVVGGGSNLVHAAIELISQLRDLLNARTQAVQGQARLVSSKPVELPRVG